MTPPESIPTEPAPPRTPPPLAKALRRVLGILAIISVIPVVIFVLLGSPAIIFPVIVMAALIGLYLLIALIEHTLRYDHTTPPIEVGVGGSEVVDGKVATVYGDYEEPEASAAVKPDERGRE